MVDYEYAEIIFAAKQKSPKEYDSGYFVTDTTEDKPIFEMLMLNDRTYAEDITFEGNQLAQNYTHIVGR